MAAITITDVLGVRPMSAVGTSYWQATVVGTAGDPGDCHPPVGQIANQIDLQYTLVCSDGRLTLSRAFAKCSVGTIYTDSAVKPAPAVGSGPISIMFNFQQAPTGLFGVTYATITAAGCVAVPQPPPPPIPPPTPPPVPPTNPNGCAGDLQPCGVILFTSDAAGTPKANGVIIRDPFGDTVLHPFTLNQTSVWRGCSMRIVPQAWTRVPVSGSGGTLLSLQPVPIVYDLYCFPYPGGYGRPTPSPLDQWPTGSLPPTSGGWKLRMSWPVRANGETIPASTYILSAFDPGTQYNCTQQGVGGFQSDWFYPDNAAQVDGLAQVCAGRPFQVSFMLGGVQDIFGQVSVVMTAIEQDYSGPLIV